MEKWGIAVKIVKKKCSAEKTGGNCNFITDDIQFYLCIYCQGSGNGI